MHQVASKKMRTLELAAASPPQTLWYRWFLMLLGAFGLVCSTVIFINRHSNLHVIFKLLM